MKHIDRVTIEEIIPRQNLTGDATQFCYIKRLISLHRFICCVIDVFLSVVQKLRDKGEFVVEFVKFAGSQLCRWPRRKLLS